MKTLTEIKAEAAKEGGFLSPQLLADLIQTARLYPVLVRCGGCRFVTPCQNVAHLTHCVEAGGDYVRDVSFAAGDSSRPTNVAVTITGEVVELLEAIQTPPAAKLPPHVLARLRAAVKSVFEGREQAAPVDQITKEQAALDESLQAFRDLKPNREQSAEAARILMAAEGRIYALRLALIAKGQPEPDSHGTLDLIKPHDQGCICGPCQRARVAKGPR